MIQGTVDLIPMCPLFRGSTVLQGTVDLIPMCPLFRGSTVLQGTVDLIPMCPLFRGSTVLQGTVDLIPMCPLTRECSLNSPHQQHHHHTYLYILYKLLKEPNSDRLLVHTIKIRVVYKSRTNLRKNTVKVQGSRLHRNKGHSFPYIPLPTWLMAEWEGWHSSREF